MVTFGEHLAVADALNEMGLNPRCSSSLNNRSDTFIAGITPLSTMVPRFCALNAGGVVLEILQHLDPAVRS